MTGKRSDNGQLRNEDLLIRNQSDNCIRERKVEIVLVSPIRRADCSKMDSLFLRLAFNLTGSLVQLAYSMYTLSLLFDLFYRYHSNWLPQQHTHSLFLSPTRIFTPPKYST